MKSMSAFSFFRNANVAKRRQKGFTLIEIIIALAVIGVAIAGMLYYQSRAEAGQKANNSVSALTTMVGNIKSTFAPSNSFAGVTAANLVSAGLVVEPFTAVGNTITDPWGQTFVVGGAQGFFGLGVEAPNSEACMKIVTGLVRNAARVTVHTAAPVFVTTATSAETMLTTGTVVKANASGAFDAGAAATGCGAATAHIGMVFR